MLLGKTKKIVEDKENEIKLNLSHNYKEAAYRSFQEYVLTVNGLRDEGKISEKDYKKIAAKIEDYKFKLKDFIKKQS